MTKIVSIEWLKPFEGVDFLKIRHVKRTVHYLVGLDVVFIMLTWSNHIKGYAKRREREAIEDLFSFINFSITNLLKI